MLAARAITGRSARSAGISRRWHVDRTGRAFREAFRLDTERPVEPRAEILPRDRRAELHHSPSEPKKQAFWNRLPNAPACAAPGRRGSLKGGLSQWADNASFPREFPLLSRRARQIGAGSVGPGDEHGCVAQLFLGERSRGVYRLEGLGRQRSEPAGWHFARQKFSPEGLSWPCFFPRISLQCKT